MYINISPTVVWIIKNDTKKADNVSGEALQVKIVDIYTKEKKTYINLEETS
jgi:hypothetical protein